MTATTAPPPSPLRPWVLLLGLWLGSLAAGPWWLLLPASGLLAVAACRARLRDQPTLARTGVALVALALLGSGGAGARVALSERGPLPELAREGGTAEMVMTVVTEPRPVEHGAWLVVEVHSVDAVRVRTRALLRLDDIDASPALGAGLTATASARPLDHEGFEGHLRRLHASVRVDPRGPPVVTHGPGPLLAWSEHARERVRAATSRRLPPAPAALAAGLSTGDTREMPELEAEAMREAGLSHLVAVSGANVALVLACVLGLAGALGVGARGRRFAGLVALVWFAVLVRWEPSVLRASVMAGLVLLAGLRGRDADALTLLPAAAMLLLLIDPMLAGQLGFLLSVGATAGVLVVAPRLEPRVPGPRPVRRLVAAGLGAQIGVAPVLLAGTGEVPLLAVPANLLAVPAAALASVLAGLAAVVAQASVGAAGVVALFALPPLELILGVARATSGGPQVGPSGAALVAAAVVLAAMVGRRRTAQAAMTGVIVVVLLAGLPGRQAGHVTTLTLTALDVGQGDAVLVEAPAGDGRPAGRMLVDGGPDAARLLAALDRQGIGQLDAVLLTHPHDDHAEGLAVALRRMSVSALLVGPRPPPLDAPPSVDAVYATAGELGIPVVALAGGDRLALGGAELEVLSPPADGSLGEEPNENSLVVRVTSDSGSILLTGDAEVLAQSRLLATARDQLAADVLKVPHHGGATNAPGFLEAVAPSVAVVSVGTGNDYGHPTAATLRDLDGVEIRRTDLEGDVRIEVGARARGPPATVALLPPDARVPAWCKGFLHCRRERAATVLAGRAGGAIAATGR